jgi:hypothetical protein
MGTQRQRALASKQIMEMSDWTNEYSLETSMDGTETLISVLVIPMASGRSLFLKKRMARYLLNMRAAISAASPRPMAHEKTASLHGRSSRDKILKPFFMRPSSGTHPHPMNGTLRGPKLRSH